MELVVEAVVVLVLCALRVHDVVPHRGPSLGVSDAVWSPVRRLVFHNSLGCLLALLVVCVLLLVVV